VPPGPLSAVGQDGDGELYGVQYGGTVLTIVPELDAVTNVLAADFDGDSSPDYLNAVKRGWKLSSIATVGSALR
jgi:hypothetical protein